MTAQSQAQFMGGQDQYQFPTNLPSHLSQVPQSQGPASLPYMNQDAVRSNMSGPTSLPTMNLYHGGSQGMATNQPYMQQNAYQQQQQQQPQMQQQQQPQMQQQQQPQIQLTENMKDLQLISFE